MKIVYCLNSIRYVGGIQQVTITKANALAEVSGNEVYIVVTDNQDKDSVQLQPLSDKVHFIDLGINYYDGDCDRSKLANFYVYALKRKRHRKFLKETLKTIKPDIVISVGQSEKYMLLSMRKRSWKVIREFHFEHNYRRKHANSLFDKVIASISDFYDYNFKEKQYDRVVVLTQEDKDTNWHNWNHVEVIPNPVSFICEAPSELKETTVVALGRLEAVKNFVSLINLFKIVVENHPDWILKIYGNGAEKDNLLGLVDSLRINGNVNFMGFSKEIESVLHKASILALSSITEGFPLVILEAMECGLPVVSYQCPCGPKDIISDGVDGFLVPVGDEQMMADRICTLIEDEELRRKMGAAAKEKAKKYHIDNITKQWMDLFNELIDNK